MEEKYKAIVLKNVDYKEDDRLLWLYACEEGKFCAVIKGVKKAKAQLKFASEPFCFGEYSLVKKGERFVVTGCSAIECFYDIRNDPLKFYAACVICDAVATLEQSTEGSSDLLVNILKHLSALCEDKVNPKQIALKFLLTYMRHMGYFLSFDKCNCCQNSHLSKLYLDTVKGGLVCVNCRSAGGIAIEPPVLTCMRLISDMPVEEQPRLSLKDEYIKGALIVLEKYISHSLLKIKSLCALIEL